MRRPDAVVFTCTDRTATKLDIACEIHLPEASSVSQIQRTNQLRNVDGDDANHRRPEYCITSTRPLAIIYRINKVEL
jgi:hypothetical protein